jgi:hypothetical protein
MTREDIIRMAREAGICMANSILLPAPNGQVEALEHFAALVAEAEREACAKVCEQPSDEIQITDDISQRIYKDAFDCAEAIRARGSK